MSTQTQSQTYELQIGGVDDPEQPYVVQWQTIEPAQPMQDGDTAASILADWRSQGSDMEPDQAARVVIYDDPPDPERTKAPPPGRSRAGVLYVVLDGSGGHWPRERETSRHLVPS